MANKIDVIFCGTPDFSIPSLEMLLSHSGVNLKMVVTASSKPVGRGNRVSPPPVADWAQTHKIPVIQTDNINKEEKFIEERTKEKIDLIIVLAFGQFLNRKILSLPKSGCFNIHASLLPFYRGAAPIQHAIINGDKETGITIQKMVMKMDAGDIVQRDVLPIFENETGEQLSTRLKFQAALSLNIFIENFLRSKIVFSPQDKAKVTFAPILKREDGLLDFKEYSSKMIVDRVRGFFPWPGTFCFLKGKRLKVFKAQIDPTKLAPGEFCTDLGILVVGTKQGSVRLKEIQLEGKKRCSDVQFLNGFRGEL